MHRLRLPLPVRRTLTQGLLLAAMALAPVLNSPAQNLPTPVAEHAQLKRMEGEWTATIKSPSGDSSGTAIYRMEMGGLWLVSEFTADMAGMQFTGRGLDGYDTHKKKFVSVWVDSVTTRPLFLEGTYDASAKTITMRGEGLTPDGSPMKVKTHLREIDADKHVFKMFSVGTDGTETEMMTIEYVRKKKP